MSLTPGDAQGLPQPSSALVAPLPTPASVAPAFLLGNVTTSVGSLANILAAETKGTRGEVALLGVLPVGPGHGHQAALTWSRWRWRRAPALPEQQ